VSEVGVVLSAPVEAEAEIGALAVPDISVPAVAETDAIIELTLSVTPAAAHKPSEACNAFSESLSLQALLIHDVVVDMNCELPQRHASSREVQLPNVIVVAEVKQGKAQVGKFESCLREGVSSDADAKVATQAIKKVDRRMVISENGWCYCNLMKDCEYRLSVEGKVSGM